MKKFVDNIPYLGIIKKAWSITRYNRYLWWFGFFVVLGGVGNMNYSFDHPGNSGLNKPSIYIQQFLEIHPYWIIIGIIVALFFLSLKILGKGALIKSAYQTVKNQSSGYKSGLKDGKRYFWKLLGLGIIILGYFLAALVILAIPVIFLFTNGNYVIGSFLAVIAVLILIPLIIILLFLREYGSLYIVLGELRVIPALESSYALFRENILSSIVMALIFIPLNIGLMVLLLLVILPFVAIFLINGLLFYLLLSTMGALAMLFLGIFILVSFLIFVRSVWEVFAQTVWVLFFQEIASPKIKETAKEKVEETEKKEEVFPEPNPVKTVEIEK